MIKLVGVRASLGALAIAALACDAAPVGKDGAASAASSVSRVGTATASTPGAPASLGSADAGPAPPSCTKNADCPNGGVCNCRCPAAPKPCDGPADACGDCAKRNMGGVCLPSCQGG